MTIETVRQICLALPAATEDVKWGNDLCFSVGGKMFAAMNLDPPHSLAFKCTPESFGELVERPGIRPAPYLARNMWVQEEHLGEALDRDELEQLVRASYDLVVAKIPKSRRPGASADPAKAGSHVRRPSKARSAAPHVQKPAAKRVATRRTARRRR